MEDIQTLATSFRKQSQTIYELICQNNLESAREGINLLSNWANSKLTEIDFAKIKEE